MAFSKFKTYLNSDQGQKTLGTVSGAVSVAQGLANTIQGVSQATQSSTDSSSSGVANSSVNRRSGWITAGSAVAATILGALSFFSGGSTAPFALAAGSAALSGTGSVVARSQKSVYG